MSTIYDQHYQLLKEKLSRYQPSRGRGHSAATVFEIRLGLAWRFLQELPLDDPSVGMAAYYRHYYPRIQSEVTYNELCYTLALTLPKGPKPQVRAMVVEEHYRIDRHIGSNPRLYAYIRLGRHDQDANLFGQDLQTAQHNSDWLAALWAFDRYKTYLNERYPWVVAVHAQEDQA
jgi:RteC protein